MIRKTQLLDEAYDVPDLREVDLRTARPARAGERCALTGEYVNAGDTVVEAESLLTSASSQPHEIFVVPDATHVTLHAARCYKHFHGGLTGNLLAIRRGESTFGVSPMISNASADEQGRPSWQRIIYGIDEHAALIGGDITLAVVTEESKRRLWLDAHVARFDPDGDWSLYMFWTGARGQSFAQNVVVHVPQLRAVLALSEYAYTLGFSKDALLRGLFHAPYPVISEVGVTRTRELDAVLDSYRGSPELPVACCVVQRAPTIDNLESPSIHQALIPCLSQTKTSSERPNHPTPRSSKSNLQPRLFD